MEAKQKLLPWGLNPAIANYTIEQKIIFIVIENIKIREFSVRTYKVRMLDVMKNFHKKFLYDIKEYLNYLVYLKQKPNGGNENTLE